MTTILTGIVVLLILVIAFQNLILQRERAAAREERRDLEDRLLVMVDPDKFITKQAVTGGGAKGSVIYMDEEAEYNYLNQGKVPSDDEET